MCLILAYFSGTPLETFISQSMNSAVSGDKNVTAGFRKVQPVGKRVHKRGRSFKIYQQDVTGRAYSEQMTRRLALFQTVQVTLALADRRATRCRYIETYFHLRCYGLEKDLFWCVVRRI